jgi:DNA invertase Pin-like site-specific DNA recombinase
VSGAKADRPGLAQALAYMRDGDTLVIWKLDRLGRSMTHLIETVNDLEKRGVGLRSVTEAIDTTTPNGRLVFHLFGALGQFERDLIRERTRAGWPPRQRAGARVVASPWSPRTSSSALAP